MAVVSCAFISVRFQDRYRQFTRHRQRRRQGLESPWRTKWHEESVLKVTPSSTDEPDIDDGNGTQIAIRTIIAAIVVITATAIHCMFTTRDIIITIIARVAMETVVAVVVEPALVVAVGEVEAGATIVETASTFSC
mmetsp:Transcript_14042/g.22597  ORF Transcript_14042/g.22597 Transcript_14042/m.22597 type:complete len:136 (-) Transcript_14042:414-821(-)